MKNEKANARFAEELMALAGHPNEFIPTAYYDPDGDCVEFLAKPDPFYAERKDDLVTVYYSQLSGEIVGSLIKGVSKFCRDILRDLPGFKIEIVGGRVKLAHLFLARLWSSKPPPKDVLTVTYRELIKVAEDVEAEVCPA